MFVFSYALYTVLLDAEAGSIWVAPSGLAENLFACGWQYLYGMAAVDIKLEPLCWTPCGTPQTVDSAVDLTQAGKDVTGQQHATGAPPPPLGGLKQISFGASGKYTRSECT